MYNNILFFFATFKRFVGWLFGYTFRKMIVYTVFIDIAHTVPPPLFFLNDEPASMSYMFFVSFSGATTVVSESVFATGGGVK